MKRCIQVSYNNESIAELRGLHFFKAVRFVARLAFWHKHRCEITMGAVGVDGCPTELLFITMPSSERVAAYLEYRNLHHMHTIVDYHGDVLRLANDDASPTMKEAGATVPQDGWEWWYHPDRQEAMTRSLRAAHVVTTPWPELIPALSRLNPRTVLLPDDHKKGGDFADGWRNVMKALAS